MIRLCVLQVLQAAAFLCDQQMHMFFHMSEILRCFLTNLRDQKAQSVLELTLLMSTKAAE